MNVVIESAKVYHFPEIYRIEQAAFSDPWSKLLLWGKLQDPQVQFIVAADGEQLLGFAIFRPVGPEAELLNLAVDPHLRRRGVGRALLSHLIRAGRAAGVEAIYLEVRESNAGATSLYQAMGFQAFGRRRGYYENPVEDAICMRALI